MSSSPPPTPSLADLLVSTPPRETSGSRSSNRFAFQQSWALRLTLDLHEKPDDYCVLFDVHDDVVALDHSAAPTKADFYQIKTKATGNWTPHQLTKQEASKTAGNPPLPSMLGKLYEHYVRFPAHVRRMAIVSNAHFDVKMAVAPAGTDRDSICLSDLETTELQGISDKLTTEHGHSSALAGLSITHLETTSLSLTDHETHAEGHVCTFLSKQGDGSIPPHPFYKAVRAEIQRRNNKECAPTTFTDLLKHKGLTRAQLQAMIDSVMSQRGQEDLLALIRQQLTDEGARETLMTESRRKEWLLLQLPRVPARRNAPVNR